MWKSNLYVLPVLIACIALTGCAIWGAEFGFGASTASRAPIPQGTGHYVNLSFASDNRVVTGVFVAILLAEGVRYCIRQDDGSLVPLERVPESDPNRRVSEQDCSAALRLDGGNLRCR